jgi:uncharacterized protein DUF2637
MNLSYRGWAYTGAILGGGVSIAANIAHSYVPPADWTPTQPGRQYSPQLGAVIGAVVWPLALFVAVEILARTPWPAGWRWIVLRGLGLVPVALVAAFVSYRHLSGLLVYYHEDPLTAALGPLAVDGLMVMATAALLVTGHHRHNPATSANHRSAADTPADRPDAASAPAILPTHLLPAARFALANHEQTHGRQITSAELAARMSITPDTAAALLANLTGGTDQLASVNGSAVATGVGR